MIKLNELRRKNVLKPTLFRMVFITRIIEMRFNNAD